MIPPTPRQLSVRIFSRFIISLLSLAAWNHPLLAAENPPAAPALGKAATPAISTSPADRIRELSVQIAHHNTLYFEKAAPEISDAEYDALKRELARLAQAFPEAARQSSVSSASDLGDDRTPGFERYRHGEPMLSLDKAYTEAELSGFLARLRERLGRTNLEFVVEPKFDGLAISVTYRQGELVRAVTRGNGREGDDVTANVLAVTNLPRRLSAVTADGTRSSIPETIELRGEIFLPNREFQRINREREAAGEPVFAHPRNLAAGTLKQHDPREVTARGLQAVIYGWGTVAPLTALPRTQREFHALVHAWGLPGVDLHLLKHASTDQAVWAGVQEIGAARPRLEFPTDGAVVKLDSIALQRELGTTDSAPRWAIAYKYAPARAETKLLAITLQVGRSGVLTPVAELAPVRLAGTTIARASLFNRAEIARRDLRIGDTVILEKAGEIIPTIVGVDRERRPTESVPFVFPRECPSCSQAISSGDHDALVRCTNESCPAQLRRRLEHFASKAAVDIDGLGPGAIEKWVAKGVVKNIPDLYRLDRGKLLALGQKVDVSTGRLLAAIEASKHAELWRFIHGLGIPGVGVATARDLARHYGSLEALDAATAETVIGTGEAAKNSASEITAQTVVDHFRDPRHRTLLADLIALGVKPISPARFAAGAKSTTVSGKIFVLTGTLPSLTREQATAQIEAAGGKVAGEVSRRTDFIVLGTNPGEKLRQAEALGVRAIKEAELIQMLQSP